MNFVKVIWLNLRCYPDEIFIIITIKYNYDKHLKFRISVMTFIFKYYTLSQ